MTGPSADDIRAAADELSGQIIATPTLPAPALSRLLGCEVHLKHEQLQYTSSFKARGAYLAMVALNEDQRKKGVITMSAGNHAQAVAFHAQNLGIHATIVMPQQTPFAKVERTRAYGAEIVLEGRNLNECEQTVATLQEQHGYTLIHPYNDFHVIRGQGTVGLEILQAVPELDCLIVPIGGGGLIGGISVVAKHLRPDIEIIGVEAELYASMSQTLAGQRPSVGGETIAEGIAVKVPGELTIPLAKAHVDDILLVTEQQLEWAVGSLAEQQRIIAEGAGAAGIAALYANQSRFAGKKVGIVICGGNIDMRLLGTILNRNMMSDGRLVRLRIDISDEPGMLASISTAIGGCGGNIVEIYHQRMFYDVPAKLAKIDAVVDTRGTAHVQEIIAALTERNFSVAVIDEQSS
ncbi:threonine dehydratase, medium form [SAR116 cluster alpha proteobacterium HIMB100]|nr:threonine dehydratase, medium form [SAR116 cluster alpha proteobacterium HIMB100]